MHFTDFSVRNLKPGPQRKVIYEDSGHGNGSLGIRVSPSGHKSWVFTYTLDKRVRHMTLGSYPAMTVADAHVAASQAAQQRKLGFDPASKKVECNKAELAAPTVADLAKDFIEKYAKPNKKKSSADVDERLLARNVLPEWGKHKASAIRRKDVVALLDKIAGRGTRVEANRTHSVLCTMFQWAFDRETIEFNPAARIKKQFKEAPRKRRLLDWEVQSVLTRLADAKMSEAVRLAIRMMFLTAVRPGEAAGATWQEIDKDERVWTIPGERTKNGETHRLPLSDQAMAVLEAAEAMYPSRAVESAESQHQRGLRAVFPSAGNGKCIESAGPSRAVKANLALFGLAEFTPRDIRRTVATGMAKQGADRIVVERVLNHKKRTVTDVYDMYDQFDEMRVALAAWGAKVASLEVGG